MAKRGRPRHPDVLTPREWEVLSLLRENLTNDQIAERLGVTVHAARYHVSEILSKLEVSTREEAAAWQPDAPPPRRRWHRALGISLGAAAALTVLAVAVLAWGVLRTSGDDAQAELLPTPTPPLTRVAVIPTASPHPSVPEPTKPIVSLTRPSVGANVLDMQLVSAQEGIVLTTDALLRTPLIHSGDKIIYGPPIDITPPGVLASDIRGMHFLDHYNGWVAQITIAPSSGGLTNQSTTNIWRTTDAGQTWQSTLIPNDLGQGLTFFAGYFDFTSAQKGWLVLKRQSNTAFSYGELYTTDDGGATWTQLSIPTGSPVYFENASDGWSAGGPVFSQLFATHDGGQTWTDVSDITPAAHLEANGTRFFALPAPINGGARLLLPTVSTADPSAPLFMLYASVDNGQLWNLVAEQEKITGDIGLGSPLAVDVLPDWSIVFASGITIYALPAGSTTVTPIGATETGDIINHFSSFGFFPPAKIDFIDLQHGWGLAHEGGCVTQSDCWQASFIEQTDDGGHTWTVLKFGSDPTPSPNPSP